MKIWVATIKMFKKYDESYDVSFSVNQSGADYVEKHDKYVYSNMDEYTYDEVPKNITCLKFSENYYSSVGLPYKPREDEINALKHKMVTALRDNFQSDLSKAFHIYMMKNKALDEVTI